MKEKIKLTELTKEELRQVTGGRSDDDCTCNCSKQNVFGNHDSCSRATIKPK